MEKTVLFGKKMVLPENVRPKSSDKHTCHNCVRLQALIDELKHTKSDKKKVTII
jgi:hypothetical protein